MSPPKFNLARSAKKTCLHNPFNIKFCCRRWRFACDMAPLAEEYFTDEGPENYLLSSGRHT